MKRPWIIPIGLLVVAACNPGVTNVDDALVSEPLSAKWTATGACIVQNGAVKFQLTGGGLRITGTSGPDDVDCRSVVGMDITFSGGDGDDRFVGGAGDDHIVGGNGDDYLDGGGGSNHINGGEHAKGDACGNGEPHTGCEVPLPPPPC